MGIALLFVFPPYPYIETLQNKDSYLPSNQ